MKKLFTVLALILFVTILSAQQTNTFNYPLYVGKVGTSTGSITLKGTTSGTVQITVPDIAGTGTIFKLPASNGTSGYVLRTDGAGVLSWISLTGYATLASPTFTGTVTVPSPFTLGSTSVTSTGTQLNYLNGATGTTGTTTSNLVFSASPTFTGTVALGSGSITMTGSLGATGAGKLTKIWSVDGEFTNLPTINGGTLKTALSLTSTDVGLNNLTNKLQVEAEDSSAYTLGYTSKYDSRFLDATSSIQTQIDAKADTTALNDTVSFADALFAEQKIYNPLDYGAVSNDGIADDDDIQEAIDAASAVGTPTWAGVVYIPAGVYLITAPIELRSDVHINIAQGARFTFETAYADAMWIKDPAEALVRCYVTGGRWYKATRTYTFARLYSHGTLNYVMSCVFRNCWVENADTVFSFRTTTDGWINANIIDNVIGWRPVTFLKTRMDGSGDAMDLNIMTDCMAQPIVSVSNYIIDNLAGNGWMIKNLICPDVASWTTGLVIGNEGTYSTIDAVGLSKAKYNDVSNVHYNYVKSDGQILQTYHHFNADNDTTYLGDDVIDMTSGKIYSPYQAVIYGSSTVKDTINKVIIGHNGATGTDTSPAGDIALKLSSDQNSPGEYNNANKSARIMSRNSGSTDYGGFLYAQTHGTANNTTTYVDAMILKPSGDALFYNDIYVDQAGAGVTGTKAVTTRTIKKTIGVQNETGVDFNFSSDADQDAENKDLGAIVPAKGEITQVVVVCTETLAGSGTHAITFRAGNASAGEQFIASTSADDINENLRSTAALTDAVVMNWSTATNIFIGADPDANWDTFTGGRWSIYITYNDYTGL